MEDYSELIKRLRRAERYCLNDYSTMAKDAASALEALIAENAELRGTNEQLKEFSDAISKIKEEYPNSKQVWFGTENTTMLVGGEEFNPIKLKKENSNLRNELCLKCGRYEEAHNGACDGCKWKR